MVYLPLFLNSMVVIPFDDFLCCNCHEIGSAVAIASNGTLAFGIVRESEERNLSASADDKVVCLGNIFCFLADNLQSLAVGDIENKYAAGLLGDIEMNKGELGFHKVIGLFLLVFVLICLL